MEGRPVQTQPDMTMTAAATTPERTNESPLHEQSHISLRALINFFVWFFVGLIVVHVAVYGLFKLYHHEAAKESVPITGLTNETVTRSIPPEPRLQPSVDHDVLPKVDLDAMHARELADFRKRGWADEKSDAVTIPESVASQVEQMSQPATRRVR
jgi:hypothetical protein